MLKLSVAVIFVGWVCLASGQQSCPEKATQYFQCLNKLKTSSDYSTIIDKMMNAAKTCGATDRNVQCWRAIYKCESDAETSTEASPVYQTTLRDSTACYTNNPNSPLAGLDSLFHSGGMGGKGKQHGRGKRQRPQPGNMGMDGDDFDDNNDFKEGDIPRDCMPNNWKRLMNCTKQSLVQDQTISSAASRLRPEVKKCDDMVTSDCEPETKPLSKCLKTALKPFFSAMLTNFKTCMTTAGFPMNSGPTPGMNRRG